MSLKRTVSIVVSILIAVLIMEGLSFSADRITLNLWTRKQTSKYLTDLREWGIQQFEKDHPNVTVNHTPMPFMDLVRKCIVSLQAGQAADVMTIPNEFSDLARGGYLLPLDKYFAQDVEDWMDFLPQLRDFDTRNGHIYGVPIDYATRVLFYNEDMFEEKGLLVPPRTWIEFREFAQRLTDPQKGMYGAGIDGKGIMITGLLYSFVHQAGGSFLNEDWTECVVNSPEGVEALTWWVDLLHKYKVLPPETPDLDFHELIGMFAAGKIAMLHAFYNMYPALEQMNPNLNYGVAVMPSCRRTFVFSPDWNFCVSKNTQHPDEAFELVKALTSTELQQKLKGYLPTRKSAAKELPEVLRASLFFGRTDPTPPGFAKFPTIYEDCVQLALLRKLTPKEALDKATQEINAILREKQAKGLTMKDLGWSLETWKRP
jgi:ABC-type glycerol-3-phosphate transport system substrate-binding protein